MKHIDGLSSKYWLDNMLERTLLSLTRLKETYKQVLSVLYFQQNIHRNWMGSNEKISVLSLI